MQYNFAFLMQKAEQALNLLTEGQRLFNEAQENYADAKDVLSSDEQAKLDAKLDEVKAKSAEVHAAIQAQD